MAMSISKCLAACSKSPTMAGKVAALAAGDQATILAILEDTFDRTRTYGLTSKGITLTNTGTRSLDSDYGLFHELLSKLASRSLTGLAAQDAVTGLVSEFGHEDQAVLLRILDRDLAMGITLEGYSKAVGRKYSKFEVPLAIHLAKAGKVDPLDGTYYVSRKLDGVRLITIVDMDSKSVKFLSRSGKEYHTLGNLVEPVRRVLRGYTGVWVLDGECCSMLDSTTEDFQGVMKQVTRKDYTMPEPKYFVFDMVPLRVFEGEERGELFHDRYAHLQALGKDPHVEVLTQELVDSEETFGKWRGYVDEHGWEGFMLRKDTWFRKGRSKDLLKVKPYMDAEFTVTGIVPGKQTFAVPGKGNQVFDGVKDLVIEPWPGEQVYVGSGLTKEQRLTWLEDPGRIVGKVVTVKFLEETVDQDGKRSLRHPTLKYVHGDRRDT